MSSPFTFGSDAPGLFELVLEFNCATTDQDLLVQFTNDTIDFGFKKPKYSESVSIDPDPVTACFFLGSGGTFKPPRSGPLHFYFNDSYFNDNVGSFTLVFDGITYVIPCTAEGIAGPFVHKGQTYSYSASGTIMYRPHSNPADDQYATPDGDVHFKFQIAPWQCPCPGSRYYGLVCKLIEIDKHSESVAVSDTAQKPPPQLWSGYLVIGSIAALTALLPDDGTITRTTGGLVEPALIQNLAGAYVTSLNVANQDRTRVTAATDCPEFEWPYPVGPDAVYTNATQLTNHVRILPGFNATVNQNIYDNSVVIGAAVGAGAGIPCEEVPLFKGEIPMNTGTLLDGSLLCNQVIQSINGFGGNSISLLSGQGITIIAVPIDHKIIINADMNQMAICPPGDDASVSQMSETLEII